MHRWTDDTHLIVGGTPFRVMGAGEDTTGGILILKPRRMVDLYLEMAEEFRGGRVFEAGIYRGGSTAFLAALLEPEKLLAIELETARLPWLDAWIDDRGQRGNVVVRFGIDQADRSAVISLLDEVFGYDALDLVIDDASHLLSPSTATFNLLFPRLRPGGLYVIEDWSANLRYLHQLRRPDTSPQERARIASRVAAHPELFEPSRFAARLERNPELLEPSRFAAWLERNPELLERLAEVGGSAGPAELGEPWSGEDPPGDRSDWREKQLERLVVRLTCLVGAHEDLVTEMLAVRDFVGFRRGPVELDRAAFDLADWT